ncbi:tripartite tricarboxylate transporter TctB family protein [Siccirubricoccus phaeus]|uniref:tripartite tricarboxylate transporter TctB family protein n=1 Tax=Siccirubricoccus phaeus TaxID=2595053 RepID=UPI0011F151FF|nr:tripartite tricarboxylate transporter TctB family protein [Siccirubricoccus phaeus]
MQLSDRITGGVLVVLGAAAAWGGSRLPAVPGQEVGPAAFPMLIGCGLIACGALIIFGIGRSFEAEEAPDTPHPWWYGLRALVPPALLLFYVLASETLGFLLTAALMILAGALTLGARWRLAVPLAVILPFLIHLAFYKLLRVPLPGGLLTAPW